MDRRVDGDLPRPADGVAPGRAERRGLSARRGATPLEDAAAIRAALAEGAVRRVLVIRAARVGDTLHVRPALELLRRALPDAFLTLVCSDYAAAATRGAPLDRIVPWPLKGRSPRRAWARRRARAELSALAPFDLALGLEDKPWGRRLAARLGCPRWHAESTAGHHVVERKAGCLTPLGLWDPAAGPPPPIDWRPSPDAARAARDLLAAWPRPRIGIQAGSHAGRWLLAPRRRRDPTAEWLARTGHALARDRGGSLVVHAGLGGAEARTAREVVARLQALGTPALLLRGLDLERLGAALGELDLLVSANTGPAHLAAAQGVPLLLLQGPSTPATWPWRPADGALRVLDLALPCSPCRGTEHGRRCLVPRCLDELPSEAVVEAARALAR